MMNNRRMIFRYVAGLAAASSLAAAAFSANRSTIDEPLRFESPEAAVKALAEATKTGDSAALHKIFGSVAAEIVSGDAVQDKADLEQFARDLQAAHRLSKNEDGSMTVEVGRRRHPFAIPLVQKDGKWFFDTAAGKEEMLNRRIGDNELCTIAVCRGYVVAQREYAELDRDGDDVIEYAQKAASTPGKQDGLYWETTGDEPPSPLGPLVAEARSEGYGKSDGNADGKAASARPYHGYVYRILTKQGKGAPGGAFDYIINGNMVAGFALLAYPIDHGSSGVMTFMVNSNGKVMQKDLGEKTTEIAAKIDAYEPDGTWTIVMD